MGTSFRWQREMSVIRIDRNAVGRGGSTRRLHQRGRTRIDACKKRETRSGMASTLIAAKLKGSTTTFPSLIVA